MLAPDGIRVASLPSVVPPPSAVWTAASTMPLHPLVADTGSPVSVTAMRDLLAIAAHEEGRDERGPHTHQIDHAGVVIGTRTMRVGASPFGHSTAASSQQQQAASSPPMPPPLAPTAAEVENQWAAGCSGDATQARQYRHEHGEAHSDVASHMHDVSDARRVGDSITDLRARLHAAQVQQQSLLLQIHNLHGGVQSVNDAVQEAVALPSSSPLAEGSTPIQLVRPSSPSRVRQAAPRATTTTTDPDTDTHGVNPTHREDVPSRILPAAPLASSSSSPSSGVHRLARAASRARDAIDSYIRTPISSRTLRARPQTTVRYREHDVEEEEEEEAEEDTTAQDAARASSTDAGEAEDASSASEDDAAVESEPSEFDPASSSPANSRRVSKLSGRSRSRPATSGRRGRSAAAPKSSRVAAKPSRTKVNPTIDQRPAYIHYVLVQYQYIVSREEAARLSTRSKSAQMAMPIRWLVTKRRHRHDGKDATPTMRDLFVVAKDIATLIHKRRGSIAKAIASFHPVLEKSRVRVYGCRSPGKPGTQLLTVLSMRGVERLMRKSKYSRAMEVWKWTSKMAHAICHSIHAKDTGAAGVDAASTPLDDPLSCLQWPKRDVSMASHGTVDLEPEDVEVVTLQRFQERFTAAPEIVLKERDEPEEEEEDDDDDDEEANEEQFMHEEEEEEQPRLPRTSPPGAKFTVPSRAEVRSSDADVITAPSTPEKPVAREHHRRMVHLPHAMSGDTQPPSSALTVKPSTSEKRPAACVVAPTIVSSDPDPAAEKAARKAAALERRRQRRREKAQQVRAEAAAVKAQASASKRSPKRSNPSASEIGPGANGEGAPTRKRVKQETTARIHDHANDGVLADVIPHAAAALVLPLSLHSTPTTTPRLTPVTLTTPPSSNYTTPPFSGSMTSVAFGINSFLHSREGTPMSSRIGSPIMIAAGADEPHPNLRVHSNGDMADIGAILHGHETTPTNQNVKMMHAGVPQLPYGVHGPPPAFLCSPSQPRAPRLSPSRRFQFALPPVPNPSPPATAFATSLSPSNQMANAFCSPTYGRGTHVHAHAQMAQQPQHQYAPHMQMSASGMYFHGSGLSPRQLQFGAPTPTAVAYSHPPYSSPHSPHSLPSPSAAHHPPAATMTAATNGQTTQNTPPTHVSGAVSHAPYGWMKEQGVAMGGVTHHTAGGHRPCIDMHAR